MAILENIPEAYQGGIIAILYLNNSDFKKICGVLEKADFSYPEKLREEIASVVPNLSAKEIRDIISTIRSLVLLQEEISVPTDELIDDLNAVVQKKNLKDVDYKKVDITTFKSKLSALLKNQSVIDFYKSEELLQNHKNIFINSRVITDIRPVFGKDVEKPPESAMIYHTLNLHYAVGQHKEHKDIYIALDSKDITTLKEVLERAEKKDRTLKNLINKTEMKLFNTERIDE